MSPKIYEFDDEEIAISYYKTMLHKISSISELYPAMWYEVVLQSSNLTGHHLVTIHIGMTTKNKEVDIDAFEMP